MTYNDYDDGTMDSRGGGGGGVPPPTLPWWGYDGGEPIGRGRGGAMMRSTSVPSLGTQDDINNGYDSRGGGGGGVGEGPGAPVSSTI